MCGVKKNVANFVAIEIEKKSAEQEITNPWKNVFRGIICWVEMRQIENARIYTM